MLFQLGVLKTRGRNRSVSFFFFNQVVLGLGLGKGYLGLWLVSTPPHPFLKRGWALNP